MTITPKGIKDASLLLATRDDARNFRGWVERGLNPAVIYLDDDGHCAVRVPAQMADRWMLEFEGHVNQSLAALGVVEEAKDGP